MERDPVYEIAAKEVLGINLPKSLVVRDPDEFVDVASNEFANTAGFFGLGVGLNYVLNRILPRLNGTGQAVKSAVLLPVMFSFMWATPFIRNYLTAKRTGKTHFTQVIGEEGDHLPTLAEERALSYKLTEYRNQAAKILGLGAATGATLGALVWGVLRNPAVRQQIPAKTKAWLKENLALKNGDFKNFNTWHAFLFWGIPAYGGWIHAARDNYERKEQILKGAAFFISFFGPAILMKQHFRRQLGRFFVADKVKAGIRFKDVNKPKLEEAKSLWFKKHLYPMLTSVALLGTSAPLMNIYLTKQRVERDQLRHQLQQAQFGNLHQGTLHRIPFSTMVANAARTRSNIGDGGLQYNSPGGLVMPNPPVIY